MCECVTNVGDFGDSLTFQLVFAPAFLDVQQPGSEISQLQILHRNQPGLFTVASILFPHHPLVVPNGPGLNEKSALSTSFQVVRHPRLLEGLKTRR